MKHLLAAAGAALIAIPATAGVSFNYELPGVKNTTATFDYSGKETFDGRATGSGQTFDTYFGTLGKPIEIKGTYTNVQILGPDQFGGDGGTNNYAVTFSESGYTLAMSAVDTTNGNAPVPLTYFGYWLSALDPGNKLEFLKGGNVVATITPGSVTLPPPAGIGPCPNAYCGNPDGVFAGQNSGEPYVFINVYFDGGDSYDSIRFYEKDFGGGYESDNHTVGYFINKGGVVPEPATWAMMILGFGLVGFAARRRGRMASTLA